MANNADHALLNVESMVSFDENCGFKRPLVDSSVDSHPAHHNRKPTLGLFVRMTLSLRSVDFERIQREGSASNAVLALVVGAPAKVPLTALRVINVAITHFTRNLSGIRTSA